MTSSENTATVCGYCRHVREPDSLAPDWQCPACLTPYAKAHAKRDKEQLSRFTPGRVQGAPVQTATQSGFPVLSWLWKTVLLAAILFGLFKLVSIEKAPPPSSAVAAPAGEVWMFSRDSCGYCKKLKNFFSENGISYTELNLDTDSNAQEMFATLEAPGVPVTLVGKKVIIGYNPDEISKAIKKAKK